MMSNRVIRYDHKVHYLFRVENNFNLMNINNFNTLLHLGYTFIFTLKENFIRRLLMIHQLVLEFYVYKSII